MSQNTSDLGIIIVDHGSRRAEANDMIFDVVRMFRDVSGAKIVEAAHMELAEPSIEQALARCVDRGAKRIVVHPYMLSPGRHSTSDIPRMVCEAAAAHPGIRVSVSEPLGVDPRIGEVIQRRIQSALESDALES